MGTVKLFITQPTQRVISKNFAMGVVKTAIIAPIIAAISSNVIKKFSEVSAVNLTDAKKASVTNSNATNNNYFMKVATVYKGNIIKNLIMDCQSYTKYRPNETTGGIFCIMAEKGGTSHGGLTEKLSPFFHAKKQEVNAYGR